MTNFMAPAAWWDTHSVLWDQDSRVRLTMDENCLRQKPLVSWQRTGEAVGRDGRSNRPGVPSIYPGITFPEAAGERAVGWQALESSAGRTPDKTQTLPKLSTCSGASRRRDCPERRE